LRNRFPFLLKIEIILKNCFFFVCFFIFKFTIICDCFSATLSQLSPTRHRWPRMSSSIITKVYLLSDTATAWSVTLTESTLVREVLAHIGKKLSIAADKLELYACYVVPERPESETQDKMDPDSTLWDVKTELQLPREAKFRWGLRLPMRSSHSDSASSTVPSIAAASASNSNSASAALSPRSSSSANDEATNFSTTDSTGAASSTSSSDAISETGWLSKRGAGVGGARWKRRWFVREADRLYYYVSDSTPEPINYIDLHQVQAIPVEPMAKERTAFDITTPNRTYKVRADTVEDRARWVAAINGVLANHQAAERKRIMSTLATKRSLVPVKDETLRLTRRDTSSTSSPTQFRSPTLPPKKATMVGEKILPVPPKSPQHQSDVGATAAPAAATAATTPVPPLRPDSPKRVDPPAPNKKPPQASEPSLARESMNRLSTLLDLMMDEEAKRECEAALSSVATLSSAHVETIKHLQAELLESQLIIAQLTDERDSRIAAERESSIAVGGGGGGGGGDADDVEPRSRAARFSIRKTGSRFEDRAYVERLEKEFMDAREELEDLRTIVAEIRGVKAALSAVLSPEEHNNE
jgi:hypothetical protein